MDAFPTTFFYHTNSFSAQLSSFWSSHVWGSRGYVLSMWESSYQQVEILKGWPLSAGSGDYFALSLTAIPELLHSARINSLDGHFASDHWFQSFVGWIEHTMISVERKITLKGQQTQNAASDSRDMSVFVSWSDSVLQQEEWCPRLQGQGPLRACAFTPGPRCHRGDCLPQSPVTAVSHTPALRFQGRVPIMCPLRSDSSSPAPFMQLLCDGQGVIWLLWEPLLCKEKLQVFFLLFWLS